MTPNQIAYYYLMLPVGQEEEYYQSLDHAVESENPLSDLTLALASCGSDLNATLSVLLEYAQAHPSEVLTVQDMVMGQLQSLWELEQMDTKQLVRVLDSIGRRSADLYPDPWYDFSLPLDYYMLTNDGIIEAAIFEQWLYHFVLDGEVADIWKLREQATSKTVHKHSLAIRYLLSSICSCFVGFTFTLALLFRIATQGLDAFFTENDILVIGIFLLPILAAPIAAWHFYQAYQKNKD